MQKLSIISLILATAISGLFCGCYDGEMECYDSNQYVFLRIVSITNIDSVHFILNDQRVCNKETSIDQKWFLCNDSTKKVPVYIQPSSDSVPSGCELRAGLWICMEHNDGLRRLQSFEYNPDNCVVSQAYPIWNGFFCEVGPFDDVELGKSKLSLQVFSDEKEVRIETDYVVAGGYNVNIIPEQDSSMWFSYKENPLDLIDNVPDRTTRNGCYDGYCVATLPIVKEKFCYDK